MKAIVVYEIEGKYGPLLRRRVGASQGLGRRACAGNGRLE